MKGDFALKEKAKEFAISALQFTGCAVFYVAVLIGIYGWLKPQDDHPALFSLAFIFSAAGVTMWLIGGTDSPHSKRVAGLPPLRRHVTKATELVAGALLVVFAASIFATLATAILGGDSSRRYGDSECVYAGRYTEC